MLGDPPSYSTWHTLGLGGMSIITAIATFWLGVFDYSEAGRWFGLAEMLLAALLLVYGILTSIRFLEARDALSDPKPRTPMYDTPHQKMTFWIGLLLYGGLLTQHLAWSFGGYLPRWHLIAIALSVLGIWLCFQRQKN